MVTARNTTRRECCVYNYIMNYRVHMYMYVEAGTRRPVTCRVCVSTST
jgi:hypothetical protein